MKKIFGSIYFRFLGVYIGVFLLSLLIPAFGAAVTHAPEIRRDEHSALNETAAKIISLTASRGMSLEDAVKLFSGNNVEIGIFTDIQDADPFLNEKDMELLNEGKVLEKMPLHDEPHKFMKVIFRAEDKWVSITPDRKNGPFADFRRSQISYVAIPLVLGMVLIIFASITVAKPVKEISEASKLVSEGDFSVRIKTGSSGELKELAENFNKMIEGLSENEYLGKEFVSNVSHEFGTPITSLTGYAKLLKQNDLPPEKRKEYADIIISESERLSRLSSDLLKLSELERKENKLIKKEFSLDEQIRSVIILLQNSWEGKELELDIELDSIRFCGDEDLLFQLWVNLISNAVRYTDKGGRIQISLTYDKAAVFSVSDSGRGMTPEETKNIFRRFYKSDKSRSSEGTGLGLAIAKKIAGLHGGNITVSSVPSKGTSFTVILPME